MKNELGIKICCENCLRDYCTWRHQLECKKGSKYFMPSKEAYEARIKELQEIEFENKLEKSHLQKEIEKAYNFISKLKEKIQEQQFTEIEASTVLGYMTQANLIIQNENARIPNIDSIFSKLEKMKGEDE